MIEVVYFDHARGDEPQEGFGGGEAGIVRLAPDGFLETDVRVRLGGNGYHALSGHRVLEALDRLPIESGPLGERRDAILQPAGLDDAARILYEADRKTYGRRYEFVASTRRLPPPCEYRIRIDNRAYQRTLSQLQHLMTNASRAGHAVRLKLWHDGSGF